MIEVLAGDAVERLREMPDESVQCCVTSPPYWGLRDYGTAEWEGGDLDCDHIMPVSYKSSTLGASTGGRSEETHARSVGAQATPYAHECGKCGARRVDSQLGLEKTPEEYVAKMVEVFREVRRVLRRDGTLWLNLGDSYAGGQSRGDSPMSEKQDTNNGSRFLNGKPAVVPPGLKPKDLCGIPWRVAFALQADGWWLRSDIIWHKPNPMPESVTDRPTKAHEYLFLLSKSANYFYDAEAIKEKSIGEPGTAGTWNGNRDFGLPGGGTRFAAPNLGGSIDGNRNKRSVWTVATAPYPEAHFATYPPDLIKPCIMSGTSAKGCCAECGAPWERIVNSHIEFSQRVHNHQKYGDDGQFQHQAANRHRDGHIPGSKVSETLGWQPTCRCDAGVQPCVVLDPFAGSGTTGMVALELGRKAVLIELNPKYVKLIEQRCDVTMGLQLA